MIELIKDLTRTKSSLRLRKNGFLLLEAIICSADKDAWESAKDYK
jgi:hypothetical protein